MFAGKAVIAKLWGVAQLHDTGNTSTDWMRMYADDPVTGTSVMYWMDGSTLKGSIAEQVEPLGQRVEVTDPEVWVNEPTNYENQVLNSASDPEWQCTVQGRYQTFMDMPDHCQRKILESFDRGLDEVFGFAHLETYQIRWGTAAEKGSYGSTITTAQQAMQFALSITHKPASGGGSSSADSGYSHQSGPMQWDVITNAGADAIADNFTRLDASNPGDPLGYGDCEDLVKLVANIAAVSSDADVFMKTLVGQVIGNLNTKSSEDFEKASRLRGAGYGDSGFKPEFRDGGDQVRHFVGGLWAGYLYGPGVGQLGMNSNEDNTITDGRGIRRSVGGLLPTISPTKESEADIALNAVSVPLGAQLTPRAEERIDVGDRGWKRIPARLGYKGLAAEIRSRVCE